MGPGHHQSPDDGSAQGRQRHAVVLAGAAGSASGFGDCAVGGSYVDRAQAGEALVISEQSGRWGRGVELRLPSDAPAKENARIDGIACPRAWSCAAAGEYSGRVFAASESGGRWQPAREIELPSNAASRLSRT